MSTAPAAVLPAERLTALNAAPADPSRDYVLYWCVMARRTRYNFALEYATACARAWQRPLVVLEALRAGYPWASDRLHRFALDGTADNAAAYREAGVTHYAYVEPEVDADHGLLEALAERSCLVVTDEFPEFFLPHMLAATGRKLGAQRRAAGGGRREWAPAPSARGEGVERGATLPPAAAARAAGAARMVSNRGRHCMAHANSPRWPGEALAHVDAVRRRWPAASHDLLDQGDAGRRALAALCRSIIRCPARRVLAAGRGRRRSCSTTFSTASTDSYADAAERGGGPEQQRALAVPALGVRERARGVCAAWPSGRGGRLSPARAAADGETRGVVGDVAQRRGVPRGVRDLARAVVQHGVLPVPEHDTFASLPEWARATLAAHEDDPRAELFGAGRVGGGGDVRRALERDAGTVAHGRANPELPAYSLGKEVSWNGRVRGRRRCTVHAAHQ